MNVKLPNNLKSPTVVIIGGGTMKGEDKINKSYEKRMDNLERNFNQRYKDKIAGSNPAKEIQVLQKSFLKKLDKFVSVNRQMLDKQNTQLISALKTTLGKRVEDTKGNGDSKELQMFIKKISSLEEAIKKISIKPGTVNHNYSGLNKSFDSFFKRMETIVNKVRPRLTPSPS